MRNLMNRLPYFEEPDPVKDPPADKPDQHEKDKLEWQTTKTTLETTISELHAKIGELEKRPDLSTKLAELQASLEVTTTELAALKANPPPSSRKASVAKKLQRKSGGAPQAGATSREPRRKLDWI